MLNTNQSLQSHATSTETRTQFSMQPFHVHGQPLQSMEQSQNTISKESMQDHIHRRKMSRVLLSMHLCIHLRLRPNDSFVEDPVECRSHRERGKTPCLNWNNQKTQSPKNACRTISTEERCRQHSLEAPTNRFASTSSWRPLAQRTWLQKLHTWILQLKTSQSSQSHTTSTENRNQFSIAPLHVSIADFYTQTLLHTDAFTHRRFYTQTPLHTDAFTHRHFYTQTILHTDTFTHRSFYTQKLLHTEAFTHRGFYTQTPLHTDAFTHRRFYIQTLLHTDTFTHAFTHRHFYTQKLSHTDAFTHRSFYTQTLSHTETGPVKSQFYLTAAAFAGAVHRASWGSCGARRRRWPAAAFCVAGAVHRASWRSCGARGRRWLAAAFREYTEPPGGWPAAAFCVAGAVHRACWRSCGARGRSCSRLRRRRLIIATHHSSTYHITPSHHNSSQLHFWQVHFSSQLITTCHIPSHHSSTSHTSLLTPHLSHHNFSSQLITSQLITAPLLTPLLTPHLSHQNSSQFHFSYLTSQVHFSHLTSHTSPKFTLSLDT